MTDVVKEIISETIKKSLLGAILLVGIWFLYGDSKEERAQHLASITARVVEAEKLARIVEQNSEALKQGQVTMLEVKTALTTEVREMRQTIERAFIWVKPSEARGAGS